MIANLLTKCRKGNQRLWFERVDPRPYALVRMAIAIAALVNLVDLWPDRHAFFAETGMIDLAVMKNAIGSDPYYSVFHHITSESGVTAVFLIAAVAMVCLGVGLCTRISAIAVFVFHLSYTYRAFPCLHGWDTLLRVFSFLVMLSPVSAVWALDRLWMKRLGWISSESRRVPCYGLTLMKIQVVVIYLQTVWLKVDDEFWRNGEFFSYFMMSMYSRFPDPAWAGWTTLSSVMTYSTLLIELAVPFLLLFPTTRGIGFLLGFGLHFGIAVTSVLHVFSVAMMATYFAFLDGREIDALWRRWGPRDATAQPGTAS